MDFYRGRDYHFIGDKAYTEDNVLVYNIFVGNVQKETSTREFLGYFEKFGEIVSVHFSDIRSKRGINGEVLLKNALLNFKDPVSAAKALRDSKNCFVYMYATACHSWLQPCAQPAATPSAADEKMSLLNLNDDCLDAIFKHMEIKDQTNLARCCCRLRNVFTVLAKVEYKDIDLKNLEPLTLWEIRNFLQMAGPYIEKISGSLPLRPDSSIIEFVGTYCVNVKIIGASGHLWGNNLQKLLRNMYLVQELNLDNFSLWDRDIPLLKKLKNLKSLTLDRNSDLSGREIKSFTSLHHLSLDQCQNILPTYFKEICQYMKNLKYLDIRGCVYLDAYSMRNIVDHLRKLETIKLTLSYNNYQINCIASLPCLKNLHLCGDDCLPVPTTFFKKLQRLKIDQLESLEIPRSAGLTTFTSIGDLKNLKELRCPNNDNVNDDCLRHLSKLRDLEILDLHYCNEFSATGLLELIQKSTKLKSLNVSRCRQLDLKFATKLLTLLTWQRQQRERNKLLELIATRDRINYSAFESFNDAAGILYISFEFEFLDLDFSGISEEEFSEMDATFNNPAETIACLRDIKSLD